MTRIAIVEDDPAILRGLADNLRHESYDVLTAADGVEGYRLVCQKQPDLVILDLMLPGMSGHEVCRRMREEGIGTPVILLTADDQEVRRVQSFEAGADDYVPKPFSLKELLGRVSAILRRSRPVGTDVNSRELDEARRVQRGLMPEEIPQSRGLGMAAVWRPAGIVGGDYFDVIKLDENTVGVCIADVCGKGLPAAMIMSNVQAAVRAIGWERTSPAKLCVKVNRIMCANTPGNAFVSLFYAVIDTNTQRLRYCNAGHNAPLLASSNGNVRALDCGGSVLGVFSDCLYDEQEVAIESGDRILLYTDGVTEARNGAGEEFGEHRLVEVLLRFSHAGPAELADAVASTVGRFSNGIFNDDVTLVAVAVGSHCAG
jgi:serine phosphatase RsbU (regulator of sigma subunit)